MEKKPTILIVEDDKPIRNFINVSLKAQGYNCLETSNGQSALALAASHHPEIMILDLGLPDIDGLEVIKNVRAWWSGSIIVVSARGHDHEKAEALDAGADDYLTKPFSVTELSARIRVALRHMGKEEAAGNSSVNTQYAVGDFLIEFDKRRVFVKKEEIHLTPLEYDLVALLAKNAGKVLTYNFLLKEIWRDYTGKDNQTLRVFMANIRRKIEENPAQPQFIITEVGVGYRFADE